MPWFGILVFAITLSSFSWGQSVPVKIMKSSSVELKINPFLRDCRGLMVKSPITQGLTQLISEQQTDQKMDLKIHTRLKLKPGIRARLLGGKVEFTKDGKLSPNTYAGQDISLLGDESGVISFSVQYEQNVKEMRIPLVFTNPDSTESVTYLQISMESEDQFIVKLIPVVNEAVLRGLCMRSQVWLGVGASAFVFQQSIPANEVQAQFTSLSPFSISAEFKYFTSPSFGIVGSYKSAPGKMDAGQVRNVKDTIFKWDTMALEGQYRPYNTVMAWREFAIYPFLKIGAQNHVLPRLVIDDQGTVNFDTLDMTNAHIGVGANVVDKSKYFIETYVNYQQLLTSNKYDISPQMMVDGSLGAGRMMGKNTAIGLFWYGQWHKFSYRKNEGIDRNPGDIDYFFSNVDLRIGWIF